MVSTFTMFERPSQQVQQNRFPPLLTGGAENFPLKQRPLVQRSGGLKLNPKWDFQEIENRGGMLLPLIMVPAIRYTQDTPQDKNELLARDISAVGSATMLYFFMQRVLSRGVNALAKPEVLEQVPQRLRGIAKRISADCEKQAYKHKFMAYAPAQVFALMASALVGPTIGAMAMKHTRAVKHWLNSPDKVKHVLEAWESQPTEEKKTKSVQLGIGATTFAAAVPLAYRSVNHWDTTQYGKNIALRAVDHDLPVLGSSLLVALGVSKLVGLLLKPPRPLFKSSQAHPRTNPAIEATPLKPREAIASTATLQFQEQEPTEEGASPWFIKLRHNPPTPPQKGEHHRHLLKAPILGAALLGTTYSVALLGALTYTLINQNKPDKLKKLFNYETAYHASHWMLPSLLLPSIRYTQDPKDKRDEFYIRDFTHFWLGALVYWGTKKSVKPLLRQFNAIDKPEGIKNPQQATQIQENAIKFTAATIATLAQIANNGILAPRFAHTFVSRFVHQNNQASQTDSTPGSSRVPLSNIAKTGTIKPAADGQDASEPYLHYPIYANYSPHPRSPHNEKD